MTEEAGIVTGLLPARRRMLGAVLRRYRENPGYGLHEAALVLERDRLNAPLRGHRHLPRRGRSARCHQVFIRADMAVFDYRFPVPD